MLTETRVSQQWQHCELEGEVVRIHSSVHSSCGYRRGLAKSQYTQTHSAGPILVMHKAISVFVGIVTVIPKYTRNKKFSYKNYK